MRVLLGYEAYNSRSGAAEVLGAIARRLTTQGHQAVIVSTHLGRAEAVQEVEPGLKLFSIPGRRNSQRQNLSYCPPHSRHRLRELVRELRPDVIHLHDCGPLSHFILAEGRRLHIPVLGHHHFSRQFVLSSLPPYLSRNRAGSAAAWYLVETIARRFYNRCAAVATATDMARRDLEQWGVRSQIAVVPNGVDTRRFFPGPKEPLVPQVARELEIPEASLRLPVVLFTGRIDQDKNIDTLLKAVPLVLESVPATFVIAGEGSARPRLERLIEGEPWREHVFFTGYIKNSSPLFAMLYRIASVCWTASPIEVQSLALLEALASGVPAVVSRERALPELVQNGRNGFLVDTYNAAGFASAVVKLLTDEGLRRKFSEESARAAEGFDLDHTCDSIIDLYRLFLPVGV